MGTVMPGAGMRATEDVSTESDLAVGDKIRGLMTLKGSQIVSPYIRQSPAADAAGNSNLLVVVGENDVEMFYTAACYLFGFNGTTWDRLRGDTNGLQIMGPAASDSPELGNPLQIGGSVDNTAPAAAAEGDVRRWRVTPEGYGLSTPFTNVGGIADGRSNSVAALNTRAEDDTGQIMQVVTRPSGLAPDGNWDRLRTLGDVAQDGLGQLCVAVAVPGAGVVQSLRVVQPSSTRATAITPASGNRVRIIGIVSSYSNAAATNAEVYFGTGASIGTTPANAIAEALLDIVDLPSLYVSFPDGGGPVGEVDEVVSVRNSSGAGNFISVIIFREE